METQTVREFVMEYRNPASPNFGVTEPRRIQNIARETDPVATARDYLERHRTVQATAPETKERVDKETFAAILRAVVSDWGEEAAEWVANKYVVILGAVAA